MKKKIYALLLCIGMIATVFAGCGKDSKNEEETSGAEKTELKYTIERDDYVGIEIEESDVTVTEEELKEYIDADLMSNYTEVKEGVVEYDMIINFDYVVTFEGEEYESYKGAEMELTEKTVFVDEELTKQFVGKAFGDEFTSNVVMAEDFEDDKIAGKEVQFKITINSQYVPSELNDEYVQNIYSYKGISTVEEYKEMYIEAIRFNTVYPIAWEKVLENITVESYDSEEMAIAVRDKMEQLEADAVDAGYTWEEYLAEEKVTEEELEKEFEEEYKHEVKFMLARDYIVEHEGVSFTEEEFSAEVMDSVTVYGLETEEEFFEFMAKYYGLEEEYFRDNMLTTKVLEFICDNITIVPDVEEETTTAATK